MPAIDWTPLMKKYKGQWVALLGDEVTVVGYGKTLKEAKKRAERKGYNKPIFTRMPSELIPFVGGNL